MVSLAPSQVTEVKTFLCIDHTEKSWDLWICPVSESRKPIFFHPLPYPLQTESLTEPGAVVFLLSSLASKSSIPSSLFVLSPSIDISV